MDFSEPEHITMMRESIRRMLDRHATREMVAQWDEADRVPRALMAQISDLGICTLTVPEEYGGAGRDIVAAMIAVEELSRRSMVIATLYIMNACYGSMNIAASGTPEQKAELLPKLANGEILFAYGLSEPDVGADLASVRTTAERKGDKVIVNGYKRWCSGGESADFIYTLVRTGPADARYKNLSFLLIPPDATGVTLTHVPAMGARGLHTNDVAFDNVQLPLSAIVGGDAGWNNGWSMLAGPTLEVEKLEVAAIALGIAAQAVDDAWAYSQQRQQFGKPICTHQSIRHMLAEAKTKLEAVRMLVYRASWLSNENLPCGVEASMAKMYAGEAGLEIAITCQKVLGAYGYAKGMDMERYVRDMLLMPIIGGSTAIQKNNIVNRLGLPR